MKHKKIFRFHSIRHRIMLIFVGLMAAMLLAIWGVNTWWLEGYYVDQKLKVMEQALTPQQRRSRQQIQQHPRPGSQQQIQLGLAAAYPGQGPQGPQQAHAAEHRVGGMGQPRPPAPQHPQQVVYQAPGGSQGHGGSQGGQLTGHIVLHPSPQPSSRVSQEPRGACCSS